MSKNGGLPKGWARAKLADLAQPRRQRVSPANYKDHPFIGMENIEAHTMRLLGTVPAGQMKSSSAFFHPSDVLYGRLRPYLNKVFRPDFEGLCSAEFIVLPDTPHLRSAFLRYRLNASDFVTFATHLNEGDRPRVDFDQIGEFEINLPPEPEQFRIVAKLEELFSDLDAGVAALQRVKANLKRYRAAVLKAAVEGKLTEEWRKENPPKETAAQLLQRILKERRKKWEEDQLAKYAAKGKKSPGNWKSKYKEPVAPDTSKLPQLPEGWCWATLAPLLPPDKRGTKTGPFGSLLKKHEHQKCGIPVLGIENIAQMRFVQGNKIFVTAEKAEQLSEYEACAGDVLISRSGTVGEVCVVPEGLGRARISTNLMRVRLVTDSMLPDFFCLLFNGSPFVLKQISKLCGGSTRDFLNTTILMTLVFPLPSLVEQKRIMENIEERLSQIAAANAQINASLRRAARLRQSILKRTFEGRLVPQDPTDEPAKILLERIDRERASQARKTAVARK